MASSELVDMMQSLADNVNNGNDGQIFETIVTRIPSMHQENNTPDNVRIEDYNYVINSTQLALQGGTHPAPERYRILANHITNLAKESPLYIPLLETAFNASLAADRNYAPVLISARQLAIDLASVYRAREQWTDLAGLLERVTVESPAHQFSHTEEAEVYLGIISGHLESGNPAKTEPWLLKLRYVLHGVYDRQLKDYWALCNARILDYKGRFLEAATLYNKALGCVPLSDDKTITYTSAALRCAILTSAGPDKDKIMHQLRQQKRTTEVIEFPLFQQMMWHKWVSDDERISFAGSLPAEDRERITEDVIQTAFLEHNIIALSTVFKNTTFASLARKLKVSIDEVESSVIRMIRQERILANVDGVDGRVFFEKGDIVKGKHNSFEDTHEERGRASIQSGMLIKEWDSHITKLGDLINGYEKMVKGTTA